MYDDHRRLAELTFATIATIHGNITTEPRTQQTMIVSHQHNFIFFAVPKTATQAIRKALANHLGPDDWQQQALYKTEVAPIDAIAAIGHGHVSAEQAARLLPTEQFSDYFKFAFVRHPLDRFVSAAAFLFRNEPAFASSPQQFLKTAFERARFQERVLIRPQSEFLTVNGQVAMDFVGRYEQISEDIAALGERLGLSELTLERVNTTRHDTAAALIDAELEAALRTFYRDDFRLFGYR